MATGVMEQFAKLFRGYEKAHGEHELFDKPDENGKVKGKASTKIGAASEDNYKIHLEGKGISLGLIPLMEDDTCWFGAIDIDIQGTVKLSEPLEDLEKRIRTLELPLVVCRSKSGGAHLYLFAEKPITAKLMVAKLTEFVAALGYGGAEVFPKQTSRVNEGDRGNWINIAYYGSMSKKEPTNRYAIRNGKPITELKEFIKYAEMMRVSSSALADVKLKMDSAFNDAPPCLQHLATFGLESGGRNVALTNFAVFFKQSQPEDWQDEVQKFNFGHVKPSLPHAEVSQIIKNCTRKDYFYTCKNPPLSSHCDKKECAQRKYGIGSGELAGEIFPIDNLTKCIAKDSVRWYVEYQGVRVECTTDDLLSKAAMQKLYLDKHNKMIIFTKDKEYQIMLKEKVETATIVHDPDDASRQGQFEQLLDSFFTASRPARNRDELVKGNSYAEDGRVYFRSEDLFQYLSVRRFTHTPHEVWMWLKQLGATDRQMKVKGKMLRVWSLPEPEKFDNNPIDLPHNVEEEL